MRAMLWLDANAAGHDVPEGCKALQIDEEAADVGLMRVNLQIGI